MRGEGDLHACCARVAAPVRLHLHLQRAALAAGPVGIAGKGGKIGVKLALKRARKAVAKAVDNAVKTAKEATERVGQAFARKPGAAGGKRAGMRMGPADKAEVISDNVSQYGRPTCENCGIDVIPPKKNMDGVTPPRNEWQTDHIIPRVNGGNGDATNGQLLCRTCNRAKGKN
jgi:hypothetical protein